MNWKSKVDGTIKETPIKDIPSDYLQRILCVVQIRQYKALETLKKNGDLEKEILAEAKKRKIELKSIDDRNNSLGRTYSDKKSIILTAKKSIQRKEKQLNG